MFWKDCMDNIFFHYTLMIWTVCYFTGRYEFAMYSSTTAAIGVLCEKFLG